jgi:hypothetical protein
LTQCDTITHLWHHKSSSDPQMTAEGRVGTPTCCWTHLFRETRYCVTNLRSPSECVRLDYVAKFMKKNKLWDVLGWNNNVVTLFTAGYILSTWSLLIPVLWLWAALACPISSTWSHPFPILSTWSPPCWSYFVDLATSNRNFVTLAPAG